MEDLLENIRDQGEQMGDSELAEISSDESSESAGFIVGGTVADPRDFPYQLLMHSRLGDCGASIIAEQWILTATHCLPPDGVASVTTVDGVEYSVEKFFPHDGYAFPKFDITVGKLKQKIPFSDTVHALKMTQYAIPFNSVCIASGYGLTDVKKRLLPTLHRTTLYVLDDATCTRWYHADRILFCAGDPKVRFRGTCYGDSGGPLACYRDNKLVLAGVVSAGEDNCRKFKDKFPAGFTNIAFFYNWINTIMKNNS